MSDTNKPDAVTRTLGDLKSAGQAVQQVGSQAMQAGSDALDQAKNVAQEAKDRAASVASAIGDKAFAVAETQKSQLADKLEDIAKAVHRSGQQMEGHQDWVAHVVERGAAELSSLATTLRRNDLQALLSDLGSLSKRKPALFIGVSMAAGFALTRVGRLAASPPVHTAASPVTPTAPATAPLGSSEASRERQ